MILHLLHSSTPKISSCWLKTLSVDAFPLINMNELISTTVNLVVLLLIGSRRPDCPSLLCCHSVSDSFVFFLFCCTTGVFPFIFKVTTTCFPHLTSRCFLLCFDSSVAILTPPPSQPFFYYQISFFFHPGLCLVSLHLRPLMLLCPFTFCPSQLIAFSVSAAFCSSPFLCSCLSSHFFSLLSVVGRRLLRVCSCQNVKSWKPYIACRDKQTQNAHNSHTDWGSDCLSPKSFPPYFR